MWQWIKEYLEKRNKIRADEYLHRLENSAYGYCGYTCNGKGPFLEIEEIKDILQAELRRKTKEF